MPYRVLIRSRDGAQRVVNPPTAGVADTQLKAARWFALTIYPGDLDMRNLLACLKTQGSFTAGRDGKMYRLERT